MEDKLSILRRNPPCCHLIILKYLKVERGKLDKRGKLEDYTAVISAPECKKINFSYTGIKLQTHVREAGKGAEFYHPIQPILPKPKINSINKFDLKSVFKDIDRSKLSRIFQNQVSKVPRIQIFPKPSFQGNNEKNNETSKTLPRPSTNRNTDQPSQPEPQTPLNRTPSLPIPSKIAPLSSTGSENENNNRNSLRANPSVYGYKRPETGSRMADDNYFGLDIDGETVILLRF